MIWSDVRYVNTEGACWRVHATYEQMYMLACLLKTKFLVKKNVNSMDAGTDCVHTIPNEAGSPRAICRIIKKSDLLPAYINTMEPRTIILAVFLLDCCIKMCL